MSKKIVVFTGNLSYSVRKGIVAIDQAMAGLSWLIVLHAPERSLRRLLRNQWRNLQKNGWRWIPYQLGEIGKRLLSGNGPLTQSCRPGTEFSMGALAAKANVRILSVMDIHSAEALAAVREFAPSLGLSLAAPILKRELFAIPALGTLNLHKGKVPDYRGMPPAFWELWNDEETVGCTVHWVDDRLDTGAVAAAGEIRRERYSTLRGLQLCLDELGVELMLQVVQGALAGEAPAIPQVPGGKTYRKPTLAQMASLKRKLDATLEQTPKRGRQLLKDAVSAVAWSLWRVGGYLMLKPRVTVLLYHRVTDEIRDNLTVGIEQFDRQMSLLREKCVVISIDHLLEAHSLLRSQKPVVCVTFDDGYLDNFINAVPILQRHQIPAAFFVSTGIVNTDRIFAHDVRRGNPAIPMMRWDHLRTMRAAGFTIGSHTVNHIDCAAESVEVVSEELIQSQTDLRRELDIMNCLFAYPYGGRQHMTPERLELVRRAGYAGCLSAYGGSNTGRVERFNVLRRGIHWEFSDRSFLFACLGLR